MSNRLVKWAFVGVLIAFALYSAYPPAQVAVRKVHVLRKTALTAEEAEENGVEVGDQYLVSYDSADRSDVVKRVAQTDAEARAHGVAKGEKYEIKRKLVFRRFLPLALGERSEEVDVIEHRPDGTVVEALTSYVQGRVKLGRDLAGGTELLYEMKARKGQSISKVDVETINILRRRIDPQNIREFSIQKQGENRILIQVPKAGRAEVDLLKARMVKMGLLEFKLAVPTDSTKHADMYKLAAEGKPVPGYEKMTLRRKDFGPDGQEQTVERMILVKEGKPEITGRMLANVNRTTDNLGRPAVGFEFNSMGKRTFASVTGQYRTWLLAIILDGQLVSAPVIKTRIAGRGIIEGDFTEQQVIELVTVLEAGSLSVDLELLQESTVGPQLGRDSIVRGLRSIIIAGLLVLVFIGFYYMACGLVADGALLLNLVLLTGVLGMLGAALTLPGVAGVLLTLGMAVDANVLIFERIREESAAGKPMHIALRNGYERAYTTIVDANVTTLLTAIILYLVGTGPVRGFAVTLSAGIVLSMFTALFVTRLALDGMLAAGWIKRFRMASIISKPALRYSRWRRMAYVISAIVVAVGVAAFVMRGSALYDVDFTGGSLVHVSVGKPTPVTEVRALLKERGFSQVEVQGVSSATGTLGSPTDFNVRIKRVGSEDLKQALIADFQQKLDAAGLAGDGAVKETPDGRGLVVALTKPANETDLRKILAGEDGDPLAMPNIAEILPVAGVGGVRFSMTLLEPAPLAAERSLWADMISVFLFSGLKHVDRAVTLGEITGEEGPADVCAMKFTFTEPIAGQVLARQMLTWGYPEIRVDVPHSRAAEFDLRGPRKALSDLKKETSETVRAPVVNFDGWTMSAELAEEALEVDLRAAADNYRLGAVRISGEDVSAEAWRVNLSYDQVKQQMTDIFAGLDDRRITAALASLDEPEDDMGRVAARMTLSESMTLAEIRHYLTRALGTAAEGVIADDLAERTRTQTVTLRLPAGKVDEAAKLIAESFSEPQPVQKVVSIGSVVAKEMKGRAVLAIICASVIIVFYVTVRFHGVKFGVAAVIALIHDVLITVGCVALADWSGALGDVKINLPMLAAFLTILGYSLNDTIVVFDRIRENMVQSGKNVVTADIIDNSVNQTLSRTILTSLTTLMVVVVLYVWGGAALQGLSFTLIIGVVVGTYSSVFIASPILLDWEVVVHRKR